jgi:HEAT repeat protein
MKAPRTIGRITAATAVLALCALPARGGDSTSPSQILYALTSIDTPATKKDLERVLEDPDNPGNELARLQGYATDPNYDFGGRLRAIRAIPHFCEMSRADCRSAIAVVLSGIDASAGTAGQKLLRRRAVIEAIGAARAGDPTDLPILVGFLNDKSRDLRVAAARALRDLCNPAAIGPLQARQNVESVAQVRDAISEALAAFAQCAP